MTSRSRRAVGILWSALTAALIALWPPPAQAGHGAHRSHRLHTPQPALRRHVKINPASRGPVAPAQTPAAVQTTAASPLHAPSQSPGTASTVVTGRAR